MMLHITGPKSAIIPFPVGVSPILDALSFDCSEYPAFGRIPVEEGNLVHQWKLSLILSTLN